MLVNLLFVFCLTPVDLDHFKNIPQVPFVTSHAASYFKIIFWKIDIYY